MPEHQLSPDLQRFIHRYMPTMQHVEVLLYLRRIAPAARTAPELIAEIPTHAETAPRVLGDLTDAKLVAAEAIGGVRRYAYGAPNPADAMAVDALADAYLTRPVSLIRYVYERPAEVVQDFANAFRVRPPKNNDR